jgi:hypothetical protein
MSFLNTPAGRALELLTNGKKDEARAILIKQYETDIKSEGNFIYCRLQNMIQHGMIEEAKDSLRQLVFKIDEIFPSEAPWRPQTRCDWGASNYAGGHRSNQRWNGQ